MGLEGKGPVARAGRIGLYTRRSVIPGPRDLFAKAITDREVFIPGIRSLGRRLSVRWDGKDLAASIVRARQSMNPTIEQLYQDIGAAALDVVDDLAGKLLVYAEVEDGVTA